MPLIPLKGFLKHPLRLELALLYYTITKVWRANVCDHRTQITPATNYLGNKNLSLKAGVWLHSTLELTVS
jgi:hypothetical protein